MKKVGPLALHVLAVAIGLSKAIAHELRDCRRDVKDLADELAGLSNEQVDRRLGDR